MARPTINENKKRKGVSISLRQDILVLADMTDNKSKFFEQSVEVCQGISEAIKELRNRKIKSSTALEEISDIIDVWESQFEDKVPFTSAPSKKSSNRTG